MFMSDGLKAVQSTGRSVSRPQGATPRLADLAPNALSISREVKSGLAVAVEVRPTKAWPVVSRGIGDRPVRLSRRYRLAVWVNGRLFGWATSARDAARLTRIWGA